MLWQGEDSGGGGGINLEKYKYIHQEGGECSVSVLIVMYVKEKCKKSHQKQQTHKL